MKYLCLGIINLLAIAAHSQCNDWQWATTDNGIERNECHGVRVDDQGYTYVAGWFDSDQLTIGGITVTNSVQGQSGNGDVYVAKLDATGNAVWAHAAGGNNSDWCWAMAIDGDGNVVITGEYFSTSLSFGNTTLTNSGLSDIFIAKYDTDGNVMWAMDAGTTGSDRGYGVDCDSSGNVYVTGDFDGTAFFGIWPLASVNGSDDVFVVKINAAGAVQWAHSYGGSGSDTGSEITVDTSGNVYVCGWYYYSAFTFDGIDYPLDDLGDSFIFKLAGDADAQWCTTFGSDSNDLAQFIDVAPNGDIVVCGDFFSTSLTIGSSTLTNSGNMDGYLARYQPDGEVIWAKKCVYSSESDYASVCTVNEFDEIYVGGHAGNDPTPFGNGQSLAQEGWFVAKYTGSGDAIWVEGDGGAIPSFAAWDQVFGVDHALGKLSVGGDFMSSELQFGDHTISHTADFGMVQGFYAHYIDGGLVQAGGITFQGATCEGNDLSIAISFTSDSPVSVQWLFNGDAIFGESDIVLDLYNLTQNQDGEYSIYLLNDCGVTASEIFTLDVLPPLPAPVLDQTSFCEAEIEVWLPPGNWSGPGINGNSFVPALAGPGNHTLGYNSIPEDEGDCIAYSTYTIFVASQPDAGSDMEGTICIEEVMSDLEDYFSDTAEGGGQWFDAGLGIPIAPVIVLSTYGIGEHAFWYVIDAIEPCIPDTAFLELQIETCPGVFESASEGIQVFPNPGTNEVSIITHDLAVIAITDALGKTVFQTSERSAGLHVIDIHAWVAGLYFVRVNGDAVRWVKAH